MGDPLHQFDHVWGYAIGLNVGVRVFTILSTGSLLVDDRICMLTPQHRERRTTFTDRLDGYGRSMMNVELASRQTVLLTL